MPVSEATYEALALEDPEGKWELHCGQLRKKPSMTMHHNDIQHELGFMLMVELRPRGYRVRIDAGRARLDDAHWYVPDVMGIPPEYTLQWRERPHDLESYSDPLPLVVEVWSRSTGDYDVEDKLPDYRRRGDLEVWRIHPYERTLTAWRRQPDGSHTEGRWRGGTVELHAIAGVTIDLAALFGALDR